MSNIFRSDLPISYYSSEKQNPFTLKILFILGFRLIIALKTCKNVRNELVFTVI